MKRYMPHIWGGLAAVFALRAMARGALGTAGQAQFAALFVPTSTAGGQE